MEEDLLCLKDTSDSLGSDAVGDEDLRDVWTKQSQAQQCVAIRPRQWLIVPKHTRASSHLPSLLLACAPLVGGQTMVWDRPEDEAVAMMGREEDPGRRRGRDPRRLLGITLGDHHKGPRPLPLGPCEHNDDKDSRETIVFRESLKGPGHWDETLLDRVASRGRTTERWFQDHDVGSRDGPWPWRRGVDKPQRVSRLSGCRTAAVHRQIIIQTIHT